jgi:GT2 family glycosyltransferase
MPESDVGVVVIGRNEGEFLRQSLTSALSAANTVVYVDSGSTDDSLTIAADLGVDVVELDPAIPFTAARAYNTGVDRVLSLNPSVAFVQFLDGDACLMPDWVNAAREAMREHPDVAVVCGRRCEKFPERSTYNLLADMEWDTPVGEVTECGPEAMMRLSLFQAVGGFDTSLIAGEEPEICFRLRQQGGNVLRIDAASSRHDMNMTRFGQWWRRSRRGGYAFAEEAWIHARDGVQYRIKECLRIWLWALGLPLAAIFLIPVTAGFSLLLLPIGYGIAVGKTYAWAVRQRQYGSAKAMTYSLFCLLIKFPELHGQVEFLWLKLLQRNRQIIEYKTPAKASET